MTQQPRTVTSESGSRRGIPGGQREGQSATGFRGQEKSKTLFLETSAGMSLQALSLWRS
jgi:hypothetical protein